MAKSRTQPDVREVDGITYRLDPGMPPPKVVEAVVALAKEILGHAPEPGVAEMMGQRFGLLVQTAWDGIEAVGFKVGYQQNPGVFHSWLGGVREGWRGLGIASRLMEDQHAWCRAQGFKTLRTHTRNKWKSMLALDLRHGFDVVGTRVDEGEAKIILEKKLSAPTAGEARAAAREAGAGAPAVPVLGPEPGWIEAVGLGRRAIPCQWTPALKDRRGVALILPGARYTTQAPLLHLAARALAGAGFSVLAAETGYGFQAGYARAPEALRMRWIGSEAKALMELALSAGRPDELVLVGKSVGTLGLASLLPRRDPRLPTRAIWLTPLYREAAVKKVVLGTDVPSLHVIGTDDQHYDAEVVEKLTRRERARLVLVQGADHAVEVPGDIGASLGALHDIAESLEAFLAS